MNSSLQAREPSPEFDNSHLKEIWARLETVARGLWIENSAAAVGLQSLIEEFRVEVAGVENTLASYRKNYLEQKDIIEKTYFAEKVSKLEASLAKSQEKITALENELSSKKSKIKEMEDFAAAKQDDLARAHDRHIKFTLENSEQFNQKIETLYQGVMAKESALLPLWGKRLKELEEQYRGRVVELEQKNQALLDALKTRESALERSYEEKIEELRAAQRKALDEMVDWSSKKLKEEQDLLRRTQSLELKTQEMEHELKKKEGELESLKENLRLEVAQVVRRYQNPEASVSLRSPGVDPIRD